MSILKPRPSNLRLETLAKKELADELLAKVVDRIVFEFHLPYLLQADCPFRTAPRLPDGGKLEFAFSRVEKRTIYCNGYELKSPYTLIRVTLSWEPKRPLRTFMNEPLTVLTEFPLHCVNGLLESYQLLTGDYAGRHLGPMELEYVPGEIWLVADMEPLRLVTHHRREGRDKESADLDGGAWLYYSTQLMSDAPKWLATKLFSEARRAVYDHEWKKAFIYAVTCIEVYTNETCARAGQQSEHRSLSKLRGLRRMLEGIATLPAVAPKKETYTRIVSEWLSHVYVLRNRIVHAGYSEINHDSVTRALTLTGNLARILDELNSEPNPPEGK